MKRFIPQALAVGLLVLVAAVLTTGAVASNHRGAAVKLGHSSLGRIIVDWRGRALYRFAHDKHGKSSCYGMCATYWPPLITHGRPRAIAGAHGALLGTTRRRNGSMQVTYNRHPLYYFAGDTRPGQIAGAGRAQ
jgi:predicted lipoprotein with Yx(FWY)xxD motif